MDLNYNSHIKTITKSAYRLKSIATIKGFLTKQDSERSCTAGWMTVPVCKKSVNQLQLIQDAAASEHKDGAMHSTRALTTALAACVSKN